MKHLTIALLTGSPLIDAGLKSMMVYLNDRGTDVINISEDNIREDISSVTPSLLIVAPPMLASITAAEIRELTDGEMPIIAVSGGRLPDIAKREFDAVISLYDSGEKIVNTIRQVVKESDDDDPKEISPREKEVIIGIVKGLSNKEIANEINVSVNTVMTHRRNIARKLQIHSPAALTVYAIVKKLVNIDDIKTILPQSV